MVRVLSSVIIAAPPVIVGTVVSAIWTLLARALFDGAPEVVIRI